MTIKKTPSSRDIGDKLEAEVLHDLRKLDAFTKTPNSGAVFREVDITSPDWLIECKNRPSKKGFSLPNKDFNKLRNLSANLGKEWAYICRNSDGKTVAVIDYDTFLEFLQFKDDRLYGDHL